MSLTIADITEIRRRTRSRNAPPRWVWETEYADVGPCIELMATWDDTLKKDEHFTSFAIDVAQAILGEVVIVTWGKWGARIEADENAALSLADLEDAANRVITHPSWVGLALATHIFTYGPAK